MPVNIYDLVEDRKTIRIPGHDLSVTYRPNSLTPARELAMLREDEGLEDLPEDEQAAQIERNIRRQVKGFCDLVEAWDFMGPLARAKDGSRLDIPKALADELELRAYIEEQGGELMVPPGQVVPIQFDNIMLLPGFFTVSIIRAINQDMSPDPKRGKR